MPGFASFIVSNLALDIQPLFLEAFLLFVFTASVLTVHQFISWSFLIFCLCSLHLPVNGRLPFLASLIFLESNQFFLKVLPKDLKLILPCRFWNLPTENEIILVLPLASPIPTTVFECHRCQPGRSQTHCASLSMFSLIPYPLPKS